MSMKCFSYTRLQLRTGMGMGMEMEMEYEPLAGESLMGHKVSNINTVERTGLEL